MPSQVKKTLVVVKSLRDLSPKKQLLVSRSPEELDDVQNQLAQTSLGNHSPSVSYINCLYGWDCLS